MIICRKTCLVGTSHSCGTMAATASAAMLPVFRHQWRRVLPFSSRSGDPVPRAACGCRIRHPAVPAAAGRALAADHDSGDSVLVDDSAAGAAGEGAAPKRRGRPKKEKTAEGADADGEPAASKPRGRKPKAAAADAAAAGGSADGVPAKKTRKKKAKEPEAGAIANLKLSFDTEAAEQQRVSSSLRPRHIPQNCGDSIRL